MLRKMLLKMLGVTEVKVEQVDKPLVFKSVATTKKATDTLPFPFPFPESKKRRRRPGQRRVYGKAKSERDAMIVELWAHTRASKIQDKHHSQARGKAIKRIAAKMHVSQNTVRRALILHGAWK